MVSYTSGAHVRGFFGQLKFWIQASFDLLTKSGFHLI